MKTGRLGKVLRLPEGYEDHPTYGVDAYRIFLRGLDCREIDLSPKDQPHLRAALFNALHPAWATVMKHSGSNIGIGHARGDMLIRSLISVVEGLSHKRVDGLGSKTKATVTGYDPIDVLGRLEVVLGLLLSLSAECQNADKHSNQLPKDFTAWLSLAYRSLLAAHNDFKNKRESTRPIFIEQDLAIVRSNLGRNYRAFLKALYVELEHFGFEFQTTLDTYLDKSRKGLQRAKKSIERENQKKNLPEQKNLWSQLKRNPAGRPPNRYAVQSE